MIVQNLSTTNETIILVNETDVLLQKAYLQKVNDDYEILQIIKENEHYDTLFQPNIFREIKHFIQFSGSMLLAFPAGLVMRNIIRKNKRLNHIMQFEALQQVRSNIEKGSFAYDTILFKQSPISIFKNKSHLANLVCLALLFGDEFIDGIANTYGKQNVKALLINKADNFYLQYRKIDKGLELYYEIDICKLLPQQILNIINEKYGIDYKTFYNHLLFLLSEMNLHLQKLDAKIAAQAATLICNVCNKCFDTYKVDVQDVNLDYNWNTLVQYQQSKDDDIIKILLTLRGVLLHKNSPVIQAKYTNWAYMVRSMQVYDDVQDAAADCDYQMNFICFFAKSFFVNEWQWLLQHKETIKTLTAQQLHIAMAVHMPASFMLCMQYNKNISNKNLNWIQLKIQNYLWRKNWLCIGTNKNAYIYEEIDFKKLHRNLHCIKHPLITDEMKNAHIIDIVLLDAVATQKLCKVASKIEMYFLKNCYTIYPNFKKAQLAQKILAQ
jgi:hypothetical protein